MKGKKGFQPGESGNPKGRKLGSPNKTSYEVKNLIQQFISSNIETLQSDFDALEPKERLLFFERILKFVIPARYQEASEFENLSDSDLDKIINELKKG